MLPHNGFTLDLALVPGTNRAHQVMRRNLSFQRASKHRTKIDLNLEVVEISTSGRHPYSFRNFFLLFHDGEAFSRR